MQRLFAAIIPVLFYFLLRRVVWGDDAEQTSAPGQAESSRLAITRYIAEKLTGAHIPQEYLSLILLAGLLLAWLMGYLLDLVLEDRAFGKRMNGLFCFFGAAGALALWVAMAPKGYAASPSTLLMIGSVGSVSLLLLAAIAKAALISRFDEVVSGARPLGPSRNAAAASRLNAVTSRRRS